MILIVLFVNKFYNNLLSAKIKIMLNAVIVLKLLKKNAQAVSPKNMTLIVKVSIAN